ncbi:MAG: type II secretory pathway pseudopilin PulG [Paraglaciecola sp.]|jgi:type II secretory pathway pseudopilin PulG
MKGFTLVEVLVASLIIMIGVTGYVTLQSEYVRSDAKLNLRNVALRLGQEKLDDLRQFTRVQSTVGQIAFNDIANDAGGTIGSGDVDIALSADVSNTVTFSRHWTVTEQYYVDTNDDGVEDTWVQLGDADYPAVLPANAAQKVVSVAVAWTDNEGHSNSISLDGNIAPIALGNSYQAKNESDNAKASPKVNYVPGEAPDVISYELGDGKKVETSKPMPDIENQGENNIVQFETVKYIVLEGEADKVEQEDFLTVNCSCALAGPGEGSTPSMTILVDDVLEVELGQSIIKMTGVPADNSQAAMCTQCCMDHHDTPTMVAEETYFRLESGAAHAHYDRQTDGSFISALSIGDDYDEVCRFKRIDGYFQIYADWQLLDIIEFDSRFLFVDANLSAYTDYAEGLIEASIKNSAQPTRSAGRDITVAPGAYQFISRGIYLDRMKSSHLTQVQNKLLAGDVDWKAITPFYDINLTLLSDWSSANTSAAIVTQEDISSIVDVAADFFGTYSRGRVEALADGSSVISVVAYAGNTGITGTHPLSPADAADQKIDDSVTVTVDSKSSTEKFFAIIGDINCIVTITDAGTGESTTDACETNNDKKSTYVDLSKLSIIETPSQFSCNVSIPKGKATPFFSCEDVSENWLGVINFSLAASGFALSISIQYPDGSIVAGGTMSLLSKLSATSNKKYNLILELSK